MCAAIGLQIESHNFYRPHFGDALPGTKLILVRIRSGILNASSRGSILTDGAGRRYLNIDFASISRKSLLHRFKFKIHSAF